MGKLQSIKNKELFHSEISIENSVKSRKKHREADDIFRNRLDEISANNLKNYNNKLKKGEIKINKNQIEARRNNCKKLTEKLSTEQKRIRSHKTAYKRWYTNKFDTFEEYYKSINKT